MLPSAARVDSAVTAADARTGRGEPLLEGRQKVASSGGTAGGAGGRAFSLCLCAERMRTQGRRCRFQEAARESFQRFPKDAFDRKLLRQAGKVYQFRHAALQDHLAMKDSQPPLL